jgi:hypothetical protein
MSILCKLISRFIKNQMWNWYQKNPCDLYKKNMINIAIFHVYLIDQTLELWKWQKNVGKQSEIKRKYSHFGIEFVLSVFILVGLFLSLWAREIVERTEMYAIHFMSLSFFKMKTNFFLFAIKTNSSRHRQRQKRMNIQCHFVLYTERWKIDWKWNSYSFIKYQFILCCYI